MFGWEADTFGTGEDAVTLWRVPGYVGGELEQPVSRDVVAGMAPMPPGSAGTPPHWRIDFWVHDVDATAARAAGRGGRIVVPAHETPIARQAVLADPQGATFSISKVTVRRSSPGA